MPPLRVLVVVASILLFAACAEPPTEPFEPTVASVTIVPDSVVLREGEGVALAVVVRDSAGNVLAERPVRWTSLDKYRVTVSPEGRVAGRQLGDARVTAFVDGASDTALVRVHIRFTQVSAGEEHSCGVSLLGFAYCWGAGRLGRLGNGSDYTRLTPVAVLGQLRYSLLASGSQYSCALTEDERAVCWGNNLSGQLASGEKRDSWVPVWVASADRFSLLTVHSRHTCGIGAGGLAYCWGNDSFGQLGSGDDPWDGTPARVAGGHRFAVLSAGFEFTCGVAMDGAPMCWGDNSLGQLGTSLTEERCVAQQGGLGPCSTIPVPVAGALRLETIAAGTQHACGLTSDGAAWCWGDNGAGQLGDGTTGSSAEPVRVAGGPFTALAAAARHTCALAPGGAAYCWGANDRGQLGAATPVEDCGGTVCNTTPVAVSGGLTFGTISAGGRLGAHTCAVGPDYVAYCWGANESAQLGLGVTSTGIFTPMAVWGQGEVGGGTR